MIELTWIRAINETERDFDRMPRIQRFKEHSPIMVGAVLYFIDREGDGKTLITSPVSSIFALHDNVMEIQTKNSVYELRKL